MKPGRSPSRLEQIRKFANLSSKPKHPGRSALETYNTARIMLLIQFH
jgi:hypothetical protein